MKYLLAFVLIFSFACNNNREASNSITVVDTSILRPQILNLSNEIALHKSVNTAAVGVAGAETDQWRRFDSLIKLGTDDELVALVDHSSANVRAYAFWALAKRKFKNIKPLLDKHISDTATFHFFSGCELGTERINMFFLNVMTPQHIDLDCIKLSAKEVAEYHKKIPDSPY